VSNNRILSAYKAVFTVTSLTLLKKKKKKRQSRMVLYSRWGRAKQLHEKVSDSESALLSGEGECAVEVKFRASSRVLSM